MDNLTHTLFALTLSRTKLGRVGRGATAALLLSSNAPDIDIVTAIRGGTSYMKWHRGPTHGPLGVIGLGVATAALVWSYERWFGPGVNPRRRAQLEPAASLTALIGLAALGVFFHILMDLPTSYGTRLLSPFDWHWYSLDWMPIVDVYLLIALAAGLVFGSITPEIRRHNVAIALALMAANYGVRGVAHYRAEALAPRLFGPTLPQRCDGATLANTPLEYWPRPPVPLPRSGSRCLVELAAMPTFLSPFDWRVVAHLSNAYELHEVDVLEHRFLGEPPRSEVLWRTSIRVPNQWTPAIAESAAAPTVRTFLGFSRFPDARSLADGRGITTVRWTDMRFAGGLFSLTQGPVRPAPFGVVVQVGDDHRVLDDRLER